MVARHKRCDVLVVGAGPVGQLLALLLARQGVKVEIVDEAWRSVGRSYAAALHPTTLEILAELGLVDRVLREACRIDTVSFYDGVNRCLEVKLAELPSPYPFVAVLPQSSLESLLDEQLTHHEVPVSWHHRASWFEERADDVQVEVDVLERASAGYAYAMSTIEISKSVGIAAGLLVGADGQGSFVRRGQRIAFEQLHQAEEYDVLEFQSSLDLASEVRIVLDDETTNVLWTLPGGRQRWSFQVAAGIQQRERIKSRLAMQVPGEASPKFTAGYLRQLIEARAPWFAGEVGDIAWAGDVRFEYRLAAQFGKGRVWLLGDAAHQTGPVGVQGMNQGLLEAVDLAARLTGVVRGTATLASLEEYGTLQRAKWLRLIGAHDRAASTGDATTWAGRRAERIARTLPLSGRHLEAVIAKLGIG